MLTNHVAMTRKYLVVDQINIAVLHCKIHNVSVNTNTILSTSLNQADC